MIRHQIVIVLIIIVVALWIGFRKKEGSSDDIDNQIE